MPHFADHQSRMNQHLPKKFERGSSLGVNSPVSSGGSRLDLFATEVDSDASQKIQHSIDFMIEHINRPLQVSTLAAQARVSPSHYFALFKKRVGCPPMDYFIRLRMRHASRLLQRTSLSVKEVAAELGYDDPFYFSRVFKSVHDVPPSRYRTHQVNYYPEKQEPPISSVDCRV